MTIAIIVAETLRVFQRLSTEEAKQTRLVRSPPLTPLLQSRRKEKQMRSLTAEFLGLEAFNPLGGVANLRTAASYPKT
jgi:hypothetical protein